MRRSSNQYDLSNFLMIKQKDEGRNLTIEKILGEITESHESLMSGLGWRTDTEGAKASKRFFLRAMMEALTTMREEGRKEGQAYLGKIKREWYQRGHKAGKGRK